MEMRTLPTKSAPSSRSGMGWILLLCLPLIAIGSVLFLVAVRTVVQSIAARSWVEVPAIIQQASLDVTKGTKGSETYRAQATYEYQFNGRTFTSSRVSFGSGSDNLGTFQKDIFQELSSYRDTKRAFRCFVNPSNPEDSVLYRETRIGVLLFFLGTGCVFGGAGLGILCGVLFSGLRAKRNTSLEKLHPDAPWLQREDWKQKRMTNAAGTSVLAGVVVALVLCVFSAPLIPILPEHFNGKITTLTLVALAFPTFAALALLRAGRNLLRWAKFGRTTLSLAHVPVVPGESLKGSISTPISLGDTTEVKLTLECKRTWVETTGNKTSLRVETEWRKDTTARPQRGGRGSAIIPVDITIPADLPSTGENEAGDSATWTLTASAQLRGADLFASYEVPVFARTSEEEPDIDTHE